MNAGYSPSGATPGLISRSEKRNDAVIEFKLPELGENIEQGDLVRLMVAPGAAVSAGQSVMELETDKAVVEVPSSVTGTIQEIKVKEGDKIKVGQVIFTVDGADAKSSAQPTAQAPAATPAPSPAPVPQKQPAAVSAPTPTPAAAAPATATPVATKASGPSEFKLPELG
jgi:pyruvate dehydrogenase E2 component (dihydrolipoamide acetyltransferase)